MIPSDKKPVTLSKLESDDATNLTCGGSLCRRVGGPELEPPASQARAGVLSRLDSWAMAWGRLW
jgi:hypothetical protein